LATQEGYTQQNDTDTGEIRTEKDLKGSGGSLIELMSFNLPGSEDDHEKSQLTNQTPT
jgi:hypothetical protein